MSWGEYETGRSAGESVYRAAVPEGARVRRLVPQRSRGSSHSVPRDIFITRVPVGKRESAWGGVGG